MSEASREQLYLAEVTRQLIQVAQVGATGGSKELAQRLQSLAKGSQALQYKRLYWILDALASRLSKPQPDMTGAPLEELGRLLADARYTCKAIKSLLGGGLDDERVREDLLGSAGRTSPGTPLKNRSMIRVAKQEHSDGETVYRASMLLDPTGGHLYAVRERRKITQNSLESSFAQLGDCPRIEEGQVLESFEPRRLKLKSFEEGPSDPVALRDYLEACAPETIGGLLELFRSRREEYLAPRNLPVFFRPRAFLPGRPGELLDREGNTLPLLRESSSHAACEHLAFHLKSPRQAGWGVFGKLVFVTGQFFFWPLSLLEPEEERLVILL